MAGKRVLLAAATFWAAAAAATGWPRQRDGMLDGCWKTKVLQDATLGRFDCQGLMRTSHKNALECRESCKEDPMCSVWQFSLHGHCWQGTSVWCDAHRNTDSPVVASQRLQHGDVIVQQDLTGWKVSGMRGPFAAGGPGNVSTGVQNCKAWCYSNLHCTHWLYDSEGCWVADAPDGAAARDEKRRHASVVAGESVRHICPARLTPSVGQLGVRHTDDSAMQQPFPAPGEEWGVTDPAIDWKWDVLVFVAIGYVLLQAAYSTRRDNTVTSMVSPMDGSPLSGNETDTEHQEVNASVHQAFLKAFWWRLPLAPMFTWFQPGHLENIIQGQFATVDEQRAVSTANPQATRRLANFLAWRRVTVSALFSFGLVHYAMRCEVLSSTWRHHRYFGAIGSNPSLGHYEAWLARHQEHANFLEYSKHKMMALLASIVAEALRGAFVVELIVCIVEFVPLILLFMALLQWTSFTKSRRFVIAAWLTAFLTPFAVSLFPARLMLQFDGTEVQIDSYIHELAVEMHLDKVQQLVLDSCGHFESDMKALGQNLQSTCTILSNLPTQLTLPCVGSLSLCHADLGIVVDQCHLALRQIQAGHVEAAMGIMVQQCANLQSAFTSGGEGERGRTQAFEALLDMIKAPVHVLMPEVERVSMTVSAFHAVFIVLPPAAATVPAIICSAIATKVLMPQSGIPGAILTSVPIILASAAFLVCTILFQYLSDPWVLSFFLVGLISLLAMLALSFFMAQPSPRSVVRRNITVLLRFSHAASFVMLFLFVGMVYTLSSQLPSVPGLTALAEWCNVSWLRLALACLAHILYCFMLTCFAVTDKMMSEISAQQHYWAFFAKEAPQSMRLGRTTFEDDVKKRRSSAASLGCATPFRDDFSAPLRFRFPSLGSPMSVASPAAQKKVEERVASSGAFTNPWDFSQEVLDCDLSELLRHRLVAERWEQAQEPQPAHEPAQRDPFECSFWSTP